MKRHWAILFIVLFIASGCRRSYHPHMPETTIPTAWKENFSPDSAFPEKNRFWELFADETLNALEEEAIQANFDLQIAASRIQEARALVMKEHGKRLPELDAAASFAADETLLNPPSFGSPVHKLERVQQRQYSLLGNLSYELDLWGKLKAREKSARHRLQASRWEHEFVYQTVVTDVALHYFSLRVFESQIKWLEKAIESWKETIDLYESRIEAGLDPELNLSRAKLELATVQGEMDQTKRQYAIQEHALATLIGKPASCFTISKGTLPDFVPLIPPVIPSEVLIRRPDIQSQQALVAAGRSDVDVALRNYFPSFPLTGSLGLVSPLLSHLFEWQARYWSYVLNIFEPLFDGGKRKADVMAAKANFLQNFTNYQKTVTQAFQDVEDALSSLHYTSLQYDHQKEAVSAASDTFSLAQQQFDAGRISYLLVADSEKTSIEVERQAIALKGEQILAWIQLMKALGIQRE